MQWNEFLAHIRHLSALDQERTKKAFELGKRAHVGQTRKSGEPYFSHPIAVAMMLADFGADADTLISALLHDTVEDTALTLDEIDEQFNGSVRTLIDGVTKLCAEDVREYPTLNEQIETLRKMFTLMQKDVRIMVIKLIDRLHNMQTIEFLPAEKKRALAKETSEVYVKIADRLSMRDIKEELEGMALAVLEPELFAKLQKQRTENESKRRDILRSMRMSILDSDPERAGHLTLVHEQTTWRKLRAQIEKAGSAATGIADATIAFVCLNTNECYHTLGVLHQLWQREAMSFQDFINSPMQNGYRGLHTTVILSDGTRVRCKIRTQEMHVYAEKGITMHCFEPHSDETQRLLPWTKRITSLTEDTERRSAEFWESLQSDILGESIMIHGPSDQAVPVPKGCTALDGAFYAFGKDALKTQIIRLNGTEVPFFTLLMHAVSLDVLFSDTPTVTLEWLTYAKSGMATALIRRALAHESPEKKMEIGKYILQELLTDRKKGFIEEIEENRMQQSVHDLGLGSLKEAYIAIAEGHVDPTDVYAALFTRANLKSDGTAYRSSITFDIPTENVPMVTRMAQIVQAFHEKIEGIDFHQRRRNPLDRTTWRLKVTPREERSIMSALQAAGATNVRIDVRIRSVSAFILSVMLLVTLWGFDPVVAHVLLRTHDIPSTNLMFVRFWSITALSGIFVLWQKLRGSHQSPLPYRKRSLWISAVLLIGVSLSSYSALHVTLPTHYTIPMTAAGILLTSIVNRKKWKLLVCTWTLLLAGTGLLIMKNTLWTLQGIAFTLAAVTCFSLFSVISERYKREEHVGSRAAQYFFALSILCTILTLPLLPLATLGTHSLRVLAQMSIFSIIFTGLPYYIYYTLLTHKQIDFVLRYSFLIIFTTLAGEFLLVPSAMHHLPSTLTAGFLVIIGALLPILDGRLWSKRSPIQ